MLLPSSGSKAEAVWFRAVLHMLTRLDCLLQQMQLYCCEEDLIGGCIRKFLDWPPGARTANGTALCH
jgi:hypothetical protein